MNKTAKLLALFCAIILTLSGCGAKRGGTAGQTQAAAQTQAATQAVTQTDSAQAIVIPVSELSQDMKLYSLEMDGVRVEVIALLASDGTVRTAFNACQVCYDSGKGYYKQVGDQLECQNCGNRFALDQLGLAAGGCNPVPIAGADRSEQDGQITISETVLKSGEIYFARRADD